MRSMPASIAGVDRIPYCVDYAALLKTLCLETHLAFVVEQPAFALDPAAVAGERAVGADDSMTGDDDANRIGAVGQAHRSYRGGTAEACGEVSVGNGRAARDLAQGTPEVALEGRACGRDGQGIDGMQLAGKVAGDGVGQAARVALRLQFNGPAGIVTPQHALKVLFVIRPERRAQIAFLIRDDL